MATEIRSYTLVIPAATPATAPVSLPISFPPRTVDGVEIVIPVGASGLVGFRLSIAGVPVIPQSSDLWIVTAGEKIAYPLEEYPNSGSWSLDGYNTGAYPHSVNVRFLLSRLGAPVPVSVPLLDDADLDGANDSTDTDESIAGVSA